MSKPRTVTRFVEQRITLGQLFYDTVSEQLGLPTKWDDIDAPIRAAYEIAAAAVAEAIESERDDAPAPQPERVPAPECQSLGLADGCIVALRDITKGETVSFRKDAFERMEIVFATKRLADKVQRSSSPRSDMWSSDPLPSLFTDEQRAAMRDKLAAAPKTEWHAPVTADDLRQPTGGRSLIDNIRAAADERHRATLAATEAAIKDAAADLRIEKDEPFEAVIEAAMNLPGPSSVTVNKSGLTVTRYPTD